MIRILVKIDRPLLDFFKATRYTIPSANSYLIVVEGFLCPRDPRGCVVPGALVPRQGLPWPICPG